MPAHEPIIDVQDLTREFTVRRKGAGPRRDALDRRRGRRG